MKYLLVAILGMVLVPWGCALQAEEPPADERPQPEARAAQATEPKATTRTDARPAERFVPSEEISEDLSVSFPSDI